MRVPFFKGRNLLGKGRAMKTPVPLLILVALWLISSGSIPAQEGNASPPAKTKSEPAQESKKTQKVGIIRTIDVILPGSEIEPIPQEDRKAPIILRMEKVDPTETGFHYRISCMGLEPGSYDLRKYLRRKEIVGSLPDRPEWHIEVVSTLPPGQILPKELDPKSSVHVGGYKYILAAAVLFWGLGFLAIILWPGPKPLFPKAQKVEKTAADRLRPLVEKALNGDLSLENQAALEATLMAFWRRRLSLEKAKPVEALASLRSHPEAGTLLRTLEDWLHRPAGKRPAVNVETLLEPYRKIQAESLEVTGSSRP